MSENRLARETSPYLLQHAHNPVDWYPWGEEAFQKARAEDRPILLSVGYSACHWCHVMEHESFENDDIAALMNRHFVNVKVDREERPDVDQIYMDAVQSMTGHGGWPMTVFLTPEGVPFYGGTYFPPADRHGIPGFPRLLSAINDAWRTRRAEVMHSSQQIVGQLNRAERLRAAEALLTKDVLSSAFHGISAQFDETEGGTSGSPKFPQPMIWEFVLRFWRRARTAGNAQSDRARVNGRVERAHVMATTTLTKMARGGMYDQLGGGFSRYSVDDHWLVPHFEKMLYDNAQLASLYLHGWLASGDPEYRRITEETLDYIVREMTDVSGGFYSAQDADSEGHEGKFFVWTPDEIRSALTPEEAGVALRYWGVDRGPNFEGKNILYVAGTPDPDAIASARRKLFDVRECRVHPGRDDKVLASWNGLAARAFAEAGQALERPDYIQVAVKNVEFILGRMRHGRASRSTSDVRGESLMGGRLLRTWKAGRAHLNGYLEDYAMVAAALIDVYEATFDRRWLDEARSLADGMLALFWDGELGGFFDTGNDHERLIVRPRNVYDNAVPCGSSVAIETLLRLALLTGESRYESRALDALRPMADLMSRHPTAFGRFLCALDFHIGPVAEIALIAGPGDGGALDALKREVFGRYLPNRIVAGMKAGDGAAATGIPLLEPREAIDGRATAYICQNYACQLPVTDRNSLAGQLDAL